MKILENIAHLSAVALVLCLAFSALEARKACLAGYQPDSPACRIMAPR